MGTTPSPLMALNQEALSKHLLLHPRFLFPFINSATSSTGLQLIIQINCRPKTPLNICTPDIYVKCINEMSLIHVHTSLYFISGNSRNYPGQHALNGFIPIHTFPRSDKYKGEGQPFGPGLGAEVTRTAAIGRC